jgi:hypothetical protein
MGISPSHRSQSTDAAATLDEIDFDRVDGRPGFFRAARARPFLVGLKSSEIITCALTAPPSYRDDVGKIHIPDPNGGSKAQARGARPAGRETVPTHARAATDHFQPRRRRLRRLEFPERKKFAVVVISFSSRHSFLTSGVHSINDLTPRETDSPCAILFRLETMD